MIIECELKKKNIKLSLAALNLKNALKESMSLWYRLGLDISGSIDITSLKTFAKTAVGVVKGGIETRAIAQ